MSSSNPAPRRSGRATKPVLKYQGTDATGASNTANAAAANASAPKPRRSTKAKGKGKQAAAEQPARSTGADVKKTTGVKNAFSSRRSSAPSPSLNLPSENAAEEGAPEQAENSSAMANAPKGRGRPKATPVPTTNGVKRKQTEDPEVEEVAAKKPTAKKARKQTEEPDVEEVAATKPTAKKARATKTKEVKVKEKQVINHAPTDRLDVFVCGEGSNGELGLGTAANVIDVKRPRLNQMLPAASVGVVQLACGGMHALALTRTGEVLSWGVNDGGALGRATGKGPLEDLDAENVKMNDADDEDDEDDSGLNPDEANPKPVTFPNGVVIVKVAAGDGISLALTDDGKVYGWGEFRGLQGEFGFWRDMDAGHETLEEDVLDDNGVKVGTKVVYELAGIIKRQLVPRLYTELSDIVDIACGNNHCLARNQKGMVFTWGIGEQHQLGRRQIERIDTDLKRSLVPQPLRTGKTSFTSIFCGADHSFAIDSKNRVHAWGFNGYGQLAVKGSQYFKESKEWKDVPAEVVGPIIIGALTDATNPVIKLAGGQKHSVALKQDGTLLTWGLIEFSGVDVSKIPPESILYNQEPGRGNIASAVIDPVPVPGLGTVVYPGCGSEHILAINAEGKAYAWGSGSVYQLGLGEDEDEPMPTLVDNSAVRGKKLTWAAGGGQYSMFAGPATPVKGEF